MSIDRISSVVVVLTVCLYCVFGILVIMPPLDKNEKRLYDKIRRGSATEDDIKEYTKLTKKLPPVAESKEKRQRRLEKQRQYKAKRMQNQMSIGTCFIAKEKKKLYDMIRFGKATEADIVSLSMLLTDNQKIPKTLSIKQLERRKFLHMLRGLLRRKSLSNKFPNASDINDVKKLLSSKIKHCRWREETELEASERRQKQRLSQAIYRRNQSSFDKSTRMKVDKIRHCLSRRNEHYQTATDRKSLHTVLPSSCRSWKKESLENYIRRLQRQKINASINRRKERDIRMRERKQEIENMTYSVVLRLLTLRNQSQGDNKDQSLDRCDLYKQVQEEITKMSVRMYREENLELSRAWKSAVETIQALQNTDCILKIL